MLSGVFNYVKSIQLENSLSPDPTISCYPLSSLRAAKCFGSITEKACDSASEEWPFEDINGFNEIARNRKIAGYERVKNAAECIAIVNSGTLICAQLEIAENWINAENGCIEEMKAGTENIYSHTVLIYGVNSDSSRLLFSGCMGDEWGIKGNGSMPVSYFDSNLIEAWIVVKKESKLNVEKININTLHWSTVDCLGRLFYALEIIDAANNNLAWTFLVQRDGILEMDEFFVHPEYRNIGYGNELMKGVNDLSKRLSLPIKCWVSHVDAYYENLSIIERMSSGLNLKLATSGKTWCACKLVTTD